MTDDIQILDRRTSADVSRDALVLAQKYLPEWAAYWPLDQDPEYFTSDDPGLVVLKILAQLHASISDQLGRAPDKHFLAFLDFYGIELRAPLAARAPIAFTLAA